MSWKLTARTTKIAVEEAIAAHLALDLETPEMVVGGSEVHGKPEEWLFEAWISREPTEGDHDKLMALFVSDAPVFEQEKLPETDWVTHSQQSVTPIRAGCFHIRTPDHPALTGEEAEGVTQFVIPAAQAFGTGHHETTSGCLEMLETMQKRGLRPSDIADIGTGTGLLGFAALSLWPEAKATGSDIDPVCGPAVIENAEMNGVDIGLRAGQMAMTIAAGMDDEMLQARAPYDLLIANILAGPLIDLAPDFAHAIAPRGHLLLSGLLTRQEHNVRTAYRAAGFRLCANLAIGEWSILWLHRGFSGE